MSGDAAQHSSTRSAAKEGAGSPEEVRGTRTEFSPPSSPGDIRRPRMLVASHEMSHTGAPIALYRLVEWLRARFDITVLCGRSSSGPLAKHYGGLGIPIISTPSGKFDVALCNTLLTYRLVRAIGASTPVVWWIHEPWNGHRMLRDFTSTAAAFSRAAEIVFVSDFQRDIIYRPWVHGRANVSVVDNTSHAPILPIDRPRRHPLLAAGKYNIVTPASVSTLKGCDILLSAAAKLTNKPIMFYFVGGMRADMERIDLSTLPNVRWMGERSPGQTLRLITAANVMCLPSRDEAQSLAILEAMALGTPIVASDIPTIQNMLRPGLDALLAPVGDHRILAGYIEMLRNDPELGMALAGSAQKVFQARFAGDRHYREMETVINRALNRGRPSP